MNDAVIVRLATETIKHLRNAISVNPCPHMVPSYNALLTAAHANHPNDTFLKALQPLVMGGSPEESKAYHGETISVAEMCALFAQLAIALESLAEGKN